MMRGEAEIRPYEESDYRSLMELWSKYFGEFSARRIREGWGWQFESNPYSSELQPTIFIVRAGGRVAGHISSLPLPFILNDERMLVSCASALITDEGYRWFAIRLLGRICKSPPAIASGMKPAVEKLFNHFGGTKIPLSRDRFTFQIRYEGENCREIRKKLRRPLTKMVTPRMVGLLFPGRVPRNKKTLPKAIPDQRSDLFIRELHVFDEGYGDLWNQMRKRFSCTLDKDVKYMNWRYFDCPTLNPYCYGSYDKDGVLTGIVVAFVRTERDWVGRPCVKYGELAELIHRDYSSAQCRGLLLAAMHRLDRERVDAITTTGLSVDCHSTLINLGFEHEITDTFSMYVNRSGREKNKHLSLDKKVWYYSAADGDTLYANSI